ncbi:MAG TPA: hypothetical protein VFR33_08210 [Candidatus Dormibacteraeota bacterium]|nr:hypothetical protein [Candidatus Dormibacteraeota bacterium]
MPADKVHRKRRRRARTALTTRKEPDVLTSLVRLGIGACSLGADEIRKRLRVTGAVSRTSTRGTQADANAELAYLAAGIAVDSVKALSHWLALASDRGRRSLALADSAAHLPGIRIATVISARPMRRYRSWITTERRHGRLETERGRRMATVLIRDTTNRSFKTITDTAVKEVAHSPEVAELVRSQSRGMATGAILEVRSNSEEADDRVERRVRSWLRIHRSGPESGARPPTEHGFEPGDRGA